MTCSTIKEFDAIPFSDEELPVHVGEEGIRIDGVFYKNIKIIKFEDLYYLVSDKAVLTITCTAVCNAQCKFCYNGITFTPDNNGFINEDSVQFDRLVAFCRAAKIKIVSFSGGEPTLYPLKLLSLVEKTSKSIPLVRRLHTNGINLNKKYWYNGAEKKLYLHLKDVGITDISISVAHLNSELNTSIMNYPGVAATLVKEMIAAGLSVRFSCYLDNDGTTTISEFEKYLSNGIDLGVKRYIFRLSSGIPCSYALDSCYTRSNNSNTTDVLKYVNCLIEKGFEVVYSQKKSDSHLYMMKKGDIQVDVDRSLEEIDPDKKIRRIIYMPNNCTYTSWIESSSFLFANDKADCISKVLSDQTSLQQIYNKYPASAARKYIQSRLVCIQQGRDIICCDTHTHTSISDGLVTPTELVLRAKENGINSIVITDHNCLADHFDEIRGFARENGVTIPFQGIEVSCVYVKEGQPFMKMHLLVYAKQFCDEFLAQIMLANYNVNSYISGLYEKLKKQIPAFRNLRPIEEIYSIFDSNLKVNLPKKQYTRTALASELASMDGISIDDAKEKYVMALPREERYRNNNWLSIKSVLKLCNKYGYVTVLAHPAWVRSFDGISERTIRDLFEAIVDLKDLGLDGIEVGHRLNSTDDQMRLLKLAREFDLLTTGGSDYHGKPRCVFGVNGSTHEEFIQLRNRVDNKAFHAEI